LPPNKTSPQGEGKVVFTVKPKTTLKSGVTISNQARIVFDQNAPINTPIWSNKLAQEAAGKLTASPTKLAFGDKTKAKRVTYTNGNKKGGLSILVSSVTGPNGFLLSAKACTVYFLLRGRAAESRCHSSR